MPVSVRLAQDVTDAQASTRDILKAMRDRPSRFKPHGAAQAATIVASGSPDTSVLALRMRSRNPNIQMPPLGTAIPDIEGLALVEHWITQLAKGP